jgi:hypothetical protein
MAHLVMIEIAKLPKKTREKVIGLCNQNLCLRCEKNPQHARGRCSGCLNELYLPAKYLGPLEAAKIEAAMIRKGTLMPRYDKSMRPKRVRTTAIRNSIDSREAS